MPWFKIWKAGKLKHVKRSTVSGSRLKKISSQCLYIYIYKDASAGSYVTYNDLYVFLLHI